MNDPYNDPFGPGVPQQQPTVGAPPPDAYAGHDMLRQLASWPADDQWILDQTMPSQPGSFTPASQTRLLFDFLNPGGNTYNGPKVPLTKPIFYLNDPRPDKLGNFTLDLLDPGASAQGLLQAFGAAPTGDVASPVNDFLASKDIDLFGTGATGAPSRLLDYAINNPLVVAIRRAIGDTSVENTQTAQQAADSQDRFFAFHSDPQYWYYLRQSFLANPTDTDPIAQLATSIAKDNLGDAYDQNAYNAIYAQIQQDRDKSMFLTSGDARTDYIAKLMFQTDQQIVQNYQQNPQPPQGLLAGFNPYSLVSLIPVVGPIIAPPPFSPAGSEAMIAQRVALGLSEIPFVGTEIAKMPIPTNAGTEDAWKNLSEAQRQAYIQRAGGEITVTTTAAIVAGFSGIGIVRGLAAAPEAAAWLQKAATGYDFVLKATNIALATGLTSAITNWGLEAASPTYAEEIGQYVDAARPVSGSAFAAIVNQLGYLGSGTYGAAQAVKLWRPVLGSALDVGARLPALGKFIPRPIFGVPEWSFDRLNFGGSAVRNLIANAPGSQITVDALEMSQKRAMMSELLNGVMDQKLHLEVESINDVITSPNSTHPLAALYKSDEKAFWDAVDIRFQEAAESTPHTATALMNVLHYYHPDLNPLASYATEEMAQATARVAKTLDDMAARGFMARYGTMWERINTVADIQAEAKKLYSEMGQSSVDVSAFGTGAYGIERGKQALMALYHHAFDVKTAQLNQVAQGSSEATEIALGSLRNLFGDEIDHVAKVLRGEEFDPSFLRADMPTTADEMMQWVFNRENINPIWRDVDNPAKLADKLEQYADTFPTRRQVDHALADAGPLNDFQVRLENEGRWTVIFKPKRNPYSGANTRALPIEESLTGSKRAARDFASVRSFQFADGTVHALKSPWIEYPMHSLDMIEWGNRGTLASLFDSATMGTRAWRIGEWQRANLHRMLTSKYRVTEAQLRDLHDGMNALKSNPVEAFTVRGKKIIIQNPTEKVMRSMQGWAWTDQARALAEQVMGKTLINIKTGLPEAIDWNHMLAKAYRQSFRLNLTAGVTSWLKSLPGHIGETAVKVGEDYYVAFRFGLSPIFKLSEYVESISFNLGRGVYWDDPLGRDMILRTLGRGQERNIFQDELDVGSSYLKGQGSLVYEGSVRSYTSGEAGGYASASQQRALAKAQQLSLARIRGEADPASLSKGLWLDQAGNDQFMRSYQSPIPDYSIAYLRTGDAGDTAAAMVRDGRDDTIALLEQKAQELRTTATPEGLQQAASIDPYLRPLADELGPVYKWQAMRLRPSPKEARFSAPVMLKPTAFKSIDASIDPGTGWSIPLTPEAYYRVKQYELQKAATQADPSTTLGALLRDYASFSSASGSEISTFSTIDEHAWEDVQAVFLQPSELGNWQRFLNRTKEDHPVRNIDVRVYDGTPGGMADAQVLYAAERAGVADLLNKPLSEFQILDRNAMRQSLNVVNLVDNDAFRMKVRELATEKMLGYDPGEPMVRVYSRWNKATQHDQLVIVVGAGDGTSLGMSPLEIEQAWLDSMQRFSGQLPSDAVGFLRNQGRSAVAWEPVPGTAGRVHVYDNPQRDVLGASVVTDAMGNRAWSDPEHKALDVVFAARFDADHSYQPLSEMSPRLNFERVYHDAKAGTVTYEPKGQKGWAYRYEHFNEGQPDHYTAVMFPDPAPILHGYQWDQQLRDIFQRFGKRPVVFTLPDEAAADAMQRLWLRGELPPTVQANYMKYTPSAPFPKEDWAAMEAFSKDLAAEGYWFHGSERPGHRPAGSVRPYYTAKDFNTVHDYANPDDFGKSIFIAEPPKNPVAFWKGSPERDKFVLEAISYLDELELDVQNLINAKRGNVPFFDVNGVERHNVMDASQVAELQTAFENKWPQLEPPTFAPSTDVFLSDARDAIFDAASAPADHDISRAMQVFDRAVDDALLGVGFFHQRAEAIQLGAKGANLDIAQRLGIDGLEFDYHAHMGLSSKFNPTAAEPVMIYTGGAPAVRTIEEAWNMAHPATVEQLPLDLEAMRIRAGIPEEVAKRQHTAVGDMADLTFTGDSITDQVEAALNVTATEPKSKAKIAAEKFGKVWNPVPFKLKQQAYLEALLINNTFADVLKGANKPLYDLYTKTLKVPHAQLTRFKVEDRWLYENWVKTGAREDFDAFVAHADKYTGGTEGAKAATALYESEDWETMMALWHLNAVGAAQDAFTTHFFSSYRSVLERSLNHPIMGVFPLSWAMKAAKEWAKFLFNNTSLGLRLGMTPAVAIKQIQRAQNEAWAMNPDNLNSFGEQFGSERGNPFSSAMYVANLMLPGDWSSLPFPLAWPIRSMIRGDFASPTNPMIYLQNWGPSRDYRLATDSMNEVANWLSPKPPRESQSGAAILRRAQANDIIAGRGN